MNSHEVLHRTIAKAGVKSVASDMALSSSLVYNVEWEDLKRVAEQFVLGCEMGNYLPTSGGNKQQATNKEQSNGHHATTQARHGG